MEILVLILLFVVLIFKQIFVTLFGGIRFVEPRNKKEHICDVCGYPFEEDDTYCPVCMENRGK
jgi:hypothetical protein